LLQQRQPQIADVRKSPFAKLVKKKHTSCDSCKVENPCNLCEVTPTPTPAPCHVCEQKKSCTHHCGTVVTTTVTTITEWVTEPVVTKNACQIEADRLGVAIYNFANKMRVYTDNKGNYWYEREDSPEMFDNLVNTLTIDLELTDKGTIEKKTIEVIDGKINALQLSDLYGILHKAYKTGSCTPASNWFRDYGVKT